MGCSDSDDDELLFGPVCTTLGDSSNDALSAPECPVLAENEHKKCVFSLKEEKRKSLRWRKEFKKKQRLARESLLDANTSISSTTDSEDDEMETIQGYVSREHEDDNRVENEVANKSLLETYETPLGPMKKRKQQKSSTDLYASTQMGYSDMGATYTREGVTFMEMLENSKPKVDELVWVKYKGSFWPARIIPKSAEWATRGCQDMQMKDDEILVRFFPVTDKQRYVVWNPERKSVQPYCTPNGDRSVWDPNLTSFTGYKKYKHGLSRCGVKSYTAWNAIMGWAQKYLDKALSLEVEEKRIITNETNLEKEEEHLEAEEEKEGEEKDATMMVAATEMEERHNNEELNRSSTNILEGKMVTDGDVVRLPWASKRLEGLELKAGYWIFYYHPAYGCNEDGKREAQIIEVRNLKERSEKIDGISLLELTSNDILPRDHPIMRLAVPPSADDIRKISMNYQDHGDVEIFYSCNTANSPPIVLEGERMHRLNEFTLIPSRVNGLCTAYDEVIKGIQEVQHHIMENVKEGTGGDISHFMVNFKSRSKQKWEYRKSITNEG